MKQEDDYGPIGTLLGTSFGSLIGLLGGPVGLAIGAATGVLGGAAVDLNNARIGEDFVQDVSKALVPIRSRWSQKSKRTGLRLSTPAWKQSAGPSSAGLFRK